MNCFLNTPCTVLFSFSDCQKIWSMLNQRPTYWESHIIYIIKIYSIHYNLYNKNLFNTYITRYIIYHPVIEKHLCSEGVIESSQRSYV